MSTRRVRQWLERVGVLMMHDARWTSVTTMVAGEPVRGSWWSHPAGREIFGVLESLHDDVAWPKLLAGKVTLVHRRLWPALAAVGSARDPWQMQSLSDDAADVLALVDEHQEIATDEIELAPGCRKLGTIVTDLERRLLVASEQEHTDAGKHVRVLRTWRRWLGRRRMPSPAAARTKLETATVAFGGDDATALLPWPRDAG